VHSRPLGSIPSDLSTDWQGNRPVPALDDVRRMGAARFYAVPNGERYFAAWKLVHLLNNGNDDLRRRFLRYLNELRGGGHPDGSWREAFGDLPAGHLGREYDGYQRRPRMNIWKTRAEWAEPAPPRVRGMRAGETHVMWAGLLAGQDPDALAEHLDRAAEVDPDWPDLFYWRAVLRRGQDAVQLLRTYTSRRPEDPRGWHALVWPACASTAAPGLAPERTRSADQAAVVSPPSRVSTSPVM
jgi:hypothetical protein